MMNTYMGGTPAPCCVGKPNPTPERLKIKSCNKLSIVIGTSCCLPRLLLKIVFEINLVFIGNRKYIQHSENNALLLKILFNAF